MKNYFVLGLALAVGGAAQAAIIDFEEFVIRDGVSPGVPSIIENAAGDGAQFITPAASDKVGYGTDYFNGLSFSALSSISFNVESAPGPWMPYINVWITNGSGKYAVIANEPSNAPLTAFYDYSSGGMQYINPDQVGDLNPLVSVNFNAMSYKIYETTVNGVGSDYSWLGGDSIITYSELVTGGWKIADPTTWGGGGAPKGGYGFNLVYGDTLSNYVSGSEGYVISNLTLNGNLEAGNAVVPVPAAAPLGLLGMGLVGLIARRRKQQS